MKQDPLPPLAPARPDTVVIEGHEAKAAAPAEAAIPPEIAFGRDPVNVIVVDENGLGRIQMPPSRFAMERGHEKHYQRRL